MMKKRRAKKGANLKFIAQYLYDKPGATATEIRRALCAHNGKAYSKGYYTEYFYNHSWGSWRKAKESSALGQYWIKCGDGPGWILTLHGLTLVETP